MLTVRYSPAALVAALLYCTPIAAQARLVVVDDGPDSAHYHTIQDAVDAAQSGDVIFVRAGFYEAFSVDGKSLTITGDGREVVTVVATATRRVDVMNLRAGQEVTLSGFSVLVGWDVWSGALRVGQNKGAVFLQDIAGSLASLGTWGTRATWPRISVWDSHDVTITRCHWNGSGSINNSRCNLFDSHFVGKDGQNGSSTGGGMPLSGHPGERGLYATASEVFLSGCTLQGGDGGAGVTFFGSCWEGPGGGGLYAAVALGTPCTVRYLDTKILSGKRGQNPGNCTPSSQPTSPIETMGPVTIIQIPGSARQIWSAPVAFVGEDVHWVFDGKPNDLVFAMLDVTQASRYASTFHGAVIPSVPLIAYLGSIPAVGSLDWSVPLPPLPATKQVGALYLQGAIVDASLTGQVTNPRHLTLASPSVAGKDCNQNGANDILECMAGQVRDDDANGVPDSCETFTVLYVDDDAPNDPGPGTTAVSDPLEDGSAAHPFDAITEAVLAAHATSYTKILVHDGVYAGTGNHTISLLGKNLCVRSVNGPGATTIDGGGVHPLFALQRGEGPKSRIEGFKLARGFAPRGAAILVLSADLVVVDCIFDSNTANSGGAILGVDCGVAVKGCRFINNKATGSGGAVLLYRTHSLNLPISIMRPASIRDCEFLNNSAGNQGGALRIINAFSEDVVSSCSMRNNSAPLGAAVYGQGHFYDCEITQNTASTHAALFFEFRSHIHGCTIANNTGGGVFGSIVEPGHSLTNTVLWGNGIEINGTARLEYCVLQGGLASTFGAVTLGDGNLFVDPRFVQSAAGDYRLAIGSPCIDSGDLRFEPSWLSTDAAGRRRRVGARIDIGAHER